ncbi:calcium-binding protein [Roseovarius ramblicola]|uniref:Calcium-binding protein n=1 Tax=Roseovarius ramblicola TaxID=2022336 RepID=A0ABV5HVK4_9RHOB
MRAAFRSGLTGLALCLGLALAPGPARPETAPPGTGLAAPGLAIGLSGIADTSTQQPFIDVMKTARPWTGRGARGAVPTAGLRAGGYLDATGWPTALPDGARALESLVLTDQPEAATYLGGRYLLRYTGEGVLRVTGRADNVRYNYDTREIRFDYTPGEGSVLLRLRSTDAGNPLRDITIVHEDHLALHAAGAVFNPLWIDRIADLRLLRFTDWQLTNGSEQVTWADRPTPQDATYGWRGVPVEVMTALANRIGADPWVNMPDAADDAYMRAFARHMHDHLDPGLKVHVEYSNEMWNVAFPQAIRAQQAATALWGADAGDDGWLQFAGMRAAQMAGIWRAVFDDTPGRLSVVAGVPTDWPGMETPMLTAPLAQAGGQIGAAPATRFDAYAVSGYFGQELGTEDMAATVTRWITASRAVARARAVEIGTDPAAAVAARGHDLAFDLAAQAIRQGSLDTLLTETLPYHAEVAARHGLDLVMYEGGSHVAGRGAVADNAALTGFFTSFNHSARMGTLYEELLAGWRAAGGTLFNAFVDVAPASRWGSWGALRHLGDDTPRWQALMRANAMPPHWDDPRPPGTFLHGVLRRAGDGAAALAGTAKADILIGGPGDDVLTGHGGDDRLHGGAGADTAVLPGRRADYAAAREGARVILTARGGTVTLVAIESVAFSGTPGAAIALADLIRGAR